LCHVRYLRLFDRDVPEMKVTIVSKFEGYDLNVYSYVGEPLHWNRITGNWSAKYRNEDGSMEEVFNALDPKQLVMRRVLETKTIEAEVNPEVISDAYIILDRRPCKIPHAELFLLEMKEPWKYDTSVKYMLQSFRGNSKFKTLAEAQSEFDDPDCDLLR
jgi:hypothetical protein